MRSTIKALMTAALVLGIAAAASAGCSKSKSSSPTGPGSAVILNLPLPANGGAAGYTFNTTGTFPYQCGLHPAEMTGSVTVDSSSVTTSINVDVTGGQPSSFSPSAVTIQVGGTVHWANNTGTPHSVVND